MTDPKLCLGAFIFDQEHRRLGVVEEFRDGLVRYSVREFANTRDKECWTLEDAVFVLLERFPVDDSTPQERMIADLLDDCATFREEADGSVYWEDRDGDGKTYKVDITLH